MKKRVYIAGPMRGIKLYNFPAFDAEENYLTRLGCEVVNPAELDRQAGFDPVDLPEDHDWNTIPPGFKLNECAMRDLSELSKCTHIVLLDGWEKSKGAKAELAFAEWLGIPSMTVTSGGYVLNSNAITKENNDNGKIRTFDTGATRDTSQEKIDFDGFLSEDVLRAYGAYMHKHRRQSDGSLRASDNWQKGIPRDEYRKSCFRHFIDWWGQHRRDKMDPAIVDMACAMLFNISGDLHEYFKAKR